RRRRIRAVSTRRPRKVRRAPGRRGGMCRRRRRAGWWRDRRGGRRRRLGGSTSARLRRPRPSEARAAGGGVGETWVGQPFRAANAGRPLLLSWSKDQLVVHGLTTSVVISAIGGAAAGGFLPDVDRLEPGVAPVHHEHTEALLHARLDVSRVRRIAARHL